MPDGLPFSYEVAWGAAMGGSHALHGASVRPDGTIRFMPSRGNSSRLQGTLRMLSQGAGGAGGGLVGGVVGPGTDLFGALLGDLPMPSRGAAFGSDALVTAPTRAMAIRFGMPLGAGDGADGHRAFVHIRNRDPSGHDRPSVTSLLSRVLGAPSAGPPGAYDSEVCQLLHVRPLCASLLAACCNAPC